MLRQALIFCALAQVLLSACEETCRGPNDCAKHFECSITGAQTSGVCIACDAQESPYDGIDNDCDPETVDFDLDGDHDNWIGAPINPGNDCNDNDPRVTPTIREVCNDSKDNDCDGEIDEIECRDRLPPVVTFMMPRRNQLITGAFQVVIEATDDVGIARVDLYADTVLLHTVLTAPYVFTVDAEEVVDGRVVLHAEAVDVAGRSASADLPIELDARTPPRITSARPIDGFGYDGLMTIDFTAVDDGAGIDTLTASLDDVMLELPGRPPYRYSIDTRPMTEGPHTLAIVATDRAGHSANRVISFFVDRTPPDIVFVSPAENALIRGSTPVIVDAVDPSGIATLTVNQTTTTTAHLELALDASTLPPGPYTITAVAEDRVVTNDVEGSGHTTTRSIRVVADDGSLVPCMGTRPYALTAPSVSGTTVGQGNDYEGGCFTAGGADVAYEFTAPVDLDALEVSAVGSMYPVALHVYRGYCGPSSQLGCAPNAGPLTVGAVRRGERVVVIVDGLNAAAEGAFTLAITGRIHPGQDCNPQNLSMLCRYGVCADDGLNGFQCPGADCQDGIDNDGDGVTDENVLTCNAPPSVTCPPSGTIPVLEESAVAATESGAILERRWDVIASPFGSTARVVPEDQAAASFRPLLAGPYGLRYTVLSEAYEYASCETAYDATSNDDLRVELIWNPMVPEASDPTDVDLHLLHPDAMAWNRDPLDCYFANENPDWSMSGVADDDPRLDLDDTDGRGPENINIRSPELGRPYRVGVLYYADDGFGPSTAYVNIFCYGTSRFAAGPINMMRPGDLWRVADVVLDGTDCQITPLPGAVMNDPDVSAERPR